MLSLALGIHPVINLYAFSWLMLKLTELGVILGMLLCVVYLFLSFFYCAA